LYHRRKEQSRGIAKKPVFYIDIVVAPGFLWACG